MHEVQDRDQSVRRDAEPEHAGRGVAGEDHGARAQHDAHWAEFLRRYCAGCHIC